MLHSDDCLVPGLCEIPCEALRHDGDMYIYDTREFSSLGRRRCQSRQDVAWCIRHYRNTQHYTFRVIVPGRSWELRSESVVEYVWVYTEKG